MGFHSNWMCWMNHNEPMLKKGTSTYKTPMVSWKHFDLVFCVDAKELTSKGAWSSQGMADFPMWTRWGWATQLLFKQRYTAHLKLHVNKSTVLYVSTYIYIYIHNYTHKYVERKWKSMTTGAAPSSPWVEHTKSWSSMTTGWFGAPLWLWMVTHLNHHFWFYSFCNLKRTNLRPFRDFTLLTPSAKRHIKCPPNWNVSSPSIQKKEHWKWLELGRAHRSRLPRTQKEKWKLLYFLIKNQECDTFFKKTTAMFYSPSKSVEAHPAVPGHWSFVFQLSLYLRTLCFGRDEAERSGMLIFEVNKRHYSHLKSISGNLDTDIDRSDRWWFDD